MPTRKYLWVFIFSPLTTLGLLIVLFQQREALAELFPDPTWKIVLILIGVGNLVVDVWVANLLKGRFEKEQRRQLENHTGRSLEEWIGLFSTRGPEGRDASITWAKMNYGLSEGEARYILLHKTRRDR